ncbi:MAG: FHA domain-containing protein [Anaerolineae bacterium]|nr:MAG: FHA domain-containing protein [Anaerolineae bacterium]
MNTKPCLHCQTPNRPDAQYCINCGQPLVADRTVTLSPTCPQCGAQVRQQARFCPACGHVLTLPSIATGKTPLTTLPTLVVRWPGGRTERHELSEQTISLGRHPDNDIVLDFSTVSARHLRLEVTTSGIRVTDLRSTNGTHLNGQLIPPDVPQPWQLGDVIRVGDPHGNSVSMTLEGAAGEHLRTRPLGMHKLAQFPRSLIGRDPSSQLHLDHPAVSWHHAEIVRQDGRFAIRDLESTNGTFVNGQPVTEWAALSVGSVIQIGPFKLVYDGRIQGLTTLMSRGHRMDALELGVQIASGRMILNDISLSVQAGEFIALVGGSGAGKSTLLKAMNGYNPATHGQMLIDGRDLYSNLDAYRMLMGYVPQDDIIHRELPVRLALWYAAKLRLPDASDGEIEGRIQEVLRTVDMTEHAEKPVRVLSGGQRKRVSIAVELLAQPDLLFLDEPTSGLDPGLEKKMMYDLNRLADQGRTVVLVTHATANIEQCHHVAFLVEGHLAYYGPPGEATDFFEARDFAEIYLKLAGEVNPEEGKAAPADLQPYYQAVRTQMLSLDGGQGGDGKTPSLAAGLLWAEHYRRSLHYQEYVVGRQPHVIPAEEVSRATPARQPQRARGSALRQVADVARRPFDWIRNSSLYQRFVAKRQPYAPPMQRASGAPARQPRRARDSALRQVVILARRHFDLIRHDVRTLFILLIMMPIIAALFMVVSNKEDLTGKQLTPAQLEVELKAELEGAEVGEKVEYMPEPTATQLITLLGLAITQAGTFGAAYEIVKERPIFKRERAVNLRVAAYVFSKVLVLSAFAIVQVASVLLIIGLKVDLGFDPIFEFFPAGALELFVTLLLAVLASIMLGLFISAVVPSTDVVLYVILVQLFVQIILSGTLFPLPDNPASKLVLSQWTMKAMGSTVDVEKLNEESMVCQVVSLPVGGTDVVCESAARDEEDLALDYEHSSENLLLSWGALLAQVVFWAGATTLLQARKKSE